MDPTDWTGIEDWTTVASGSNYGDLLYAFTGELCDPESRTYTARNRLHLKAGERVHVRFPDGSAAEHELVNQAQSYSFHEQGQLNSSHGTSERFGVMAEAQGVPVFVDLTKLEVSRAEFSRFKRPR